MSSSKNDLLSLCSMLGISRVKNKTKAELRAMIKEYQDVKDVTLLQNGKKIKKIYHLADIHIRVLERHVEYQQVFENLYEYLQQEEQLEHAVLVICGDIFHNRDHLVS